MARIFIYNGNKYEDPGEAYSIDDVRQHLTQFFPELAQATHSEKTLDDGNVEITFAKKVGTKGAVLHRFQVNGYVDYSYWHTDRRRWKTTVEAIDEDQAKQLALAKFPYGDEADWDYSIPIEVDDLGEIPQDILMRRAGQPELPLGVYS